MIIISESETNSTKRCSCTYNWFERRYLEPTVLELNKKKEFQVLTKKSTSSRQIWFELNSQNLSITKNITFNICENRLNNDGNKQRKAYQSEENKREAH